MNRIILSLFTLLIAFGMQAQVSLTTAPDFTVTTLEGDVVNLYDILDGGQHVVLDLMGYWCGPCCDIAPDVKSLYEDYGCNEGDLFFLSVDDVGSDQLCENFETSCGSQDGAPMASGAMGGGAAVHNMYSPAFVPTLVLIAPDRSIVDNDIWPDVVGETNQLAAANGIDMQDCGAAVTAPTAAFTAATSDYSVVLTQNSLEADSYEWSFGDGNTSIEADPGTYTYAANGSYEICLTATNTGGTDETCSTIEIGVPTAAFTATITDMTIDLTNNTTDGVSYTWTFGDGSDPVTGEDISTYTYAAAGDYTVCLSVTGASGSNEVCEDITIAEIVGILETSLVSTFNIYPNPAINELNIDVRSGLPQVDVIIHNIKGQIVFESKNVNTQQLTQIDLSSLSEGQYFINLSANQKTLAIEKLTILR